MQNDTQLVLAAVKSTLEEHGVTMLPPEMSKVIPMLTDICTLELSDSVLVFDPSRYEAEDFAQLVSGEHLNG